MKRAAVCKALGALRLDGWSVLFQEQRRSSLHLTKDAEIETIIDATRDQAEVTVYRKAGKRLGDARFTIFSEDGLREKVRDALLIAAASQKPAWPLPRKARLPRVRTADPELHKAFADGRTEELNLALWRRMHVAATRERGVTLNHAELHLLAIRQGVRNSAGVRAASEHTSLFVEAVVTARRGKEEAEFQAARTVGRLADFDAGAFIRDAAAKARDVLAATRPSTVHERAILLSGDALRDFWSPDIAFNPLVFHAVAAAKHRGLSRFVQGERVGPDGLTLGSDPSPPFSPASSRFDDEGVPSRKVTLIEDGRWHGLAAAQRYAHYLGVPATGRLGAVALAPGAEKAAALRDDGAVEIVSFSSFVPNSISGDFSAEIRLGYRHEKGRRVPVKGAMFTGNVFRMLDGMRRSRETAARDRYTGPALIRFDEGCHLAGF